MDTSATFFCVQCRLLQRPTTSCAECGAPTTASVELVRELLHYRDMSLRHQREWALATAFLAGSSLALPLLAPFAIGSMLALGVNRLRGARRKRTIAGIAIPPVTAARGDNPPPLRITRAGLQAIGVETEGDPSEGATPAKRKARASAKPGKAAAGQKPTPRAGTKQALMIDLLKRPEGATVEQIAAATGWQHHTIRGAISGALKKKLGLTVEATRTREVGPNKTGAKGSSTLYRIVS